jgi:predicted DNA-binding antitoxin AbrB/MazE fold protein
MGLKIGDLRRRFALMAALSTNYRLPDVAAATRGRSHFWTAGAPPRYSLNMTFHTDAVYEAGVLRPLAPLSLREHQVVSLAISITSEEALSPGELVRDHSAFLNSYAPEDEGLYDDYSAG